MIYHDAWILVSVQIHAFLKTMLHECFLSLCLPFNSYSTPPTPSLDDAGVLASVEAKSSDDPVTGADARRCLRKLNDKYRKCVTLIYLNGLSYEELAAEMGASLGSVRSWVHRAVRELVCAWENDERRS